MVPCHTLRIETVGDDVRGTVLVGYNFQCPYHSWHLASVALYSYLDLVES
jgi:hypothetical protein